MCDLLVALPAATAAGRTLFAKASDRPPGELQVLERLPPRHEASTRTTYLDIVAELGGSDGPVIRVADGNPCRSGFRDAPFR